MKKKNNTNARTHSKYHAAVGCALGVTVVVYCRCAVVSPASPRIERRRNYARPLCSLSVYAVATLIAKTVVHGRKSTDHRIRPGTLFYCEPPYYGNIPFLFSRILLPTSSLRENIAFRRCWHHDTTSTPYERDKKKKKEKKLYEKRV